MSFITRTYRGLSEMLVYCLHGYHGHRPSIVVSDMTGYASSHLLFHTLQRRGAMKAYLFPPGIQQKDSGRGSNPESLDQSPTL